MSDDSIGIDISKDRLDAARLSDGGRRSFSNDAAGFRRLRAWLRATPPARVVYEPIGPYHAAFERACAGHLPLVKVNPLQARRFAQARGVRAKTDAVGAGMLARMGAAFTLEPDRPLPTGQRELKELQVERCALVRDRTRLINRLKTQTLALTKRQTRARLAQLDRQIAAIQAAIEARLRDSRPRPLGVPRSIPGIGPVAASAILAGLAPMARQSGRWKGQAFIQGGRKPLRNALYMPAVVAIRFNPDMRAKYDAMRAAGKPAKVAITAVMRKLLELANALIKADRTWTPKPA